ncbi:MAG: DMT family protein [Rikenellaceae bacterium]
MLQTALSTILLLIVSNIFMIFAWYGHLKLHDSGVSTNWPLFGVILFSWGIALLEYVFQVPANRMGFIGNGGPFTLMQLKVMQEVITLIVFTIFANCFFQGNELKWNHLVAFMLLIGAVYFVFLDSSK